MKDTRIGYRKTWAQFLALSLTYLVTMSKWGDLLRPSCSSDWLQERMRKTEMGSQTLTVKEARASLKNSKTETWDQLSDLKKQVGDDVAQVETERDMWQKSNQELTENERKNHNNNNNPPHLGHSPRRRWRLINATAEAAEQLGEGTRSVYNPKNSSLPQAS